jgi:large subunit ribosomal protein L31
MRSGMHPRYRTVVFRDSAGGATYRTRSTVRTDQTVDLVPQRLRRAAGRGLLP